MSLYSYLQNEYRYDPWYRFYPPTIIVNNVSQQVIDEYIEEKLKEREFNSSKEFIDNIANFIDSIIEEKLNEQQQQQQEPQPNDEEPSDEPEEDNETSTVGDISISTVQSNGAVTLFLNGDLNNLHHYHWLVIFDYTIQEFITNEPQLKLDNLYYHMYSSAERVKVILHLEHKSQEFIVK